MIKLPDLQYRIFAASHNGGSMNSANILHCRPPSGSSQRIQQTNSVQSPDPSTNVAFTRPPWAISLRGGRCLQISGANDPESYTPAGCNSAADAATADERTGS